MNKINSYISDKFPLAFAHPLKRYFIPAAGIAGSHLCSNAEILINNRVLRNFVASDYPVCTVEKGGHIIVDFGREIAGGVRLVTSWMEPCQVRLRFGESISECCGQPNMDHAIHDIVLPLQLLSSVDFGGTAFRYVRLDALTEKFTLSNVIAIAEVADIEPQGFFRSSDARLNQIFDTALYTVYLNIQDFIYDGVKRDRLLWGGDLHPEMLTILHSFGNVPQLRQTLQEICFHTTPGSYVNNHTEYNLWVLLCIHTLWLYTGDGSIPAEFIDFITSSVKKFLPMIKPDGNVKIDDPAFLDWPSEEDPAATQAGLYALLKITLEAVVDMYKFLQIDSADVEQALAAFGLQIPDPGINKSAAALQHLAQVADRRDILENKPFNGVSTFLGCYILMAKENQSALDLIRRYWGGMLDMGATSFWEDFNLEWCSNATRIDEMPIAGRPDIHADFGAYCYKGLRHSLCHGWASGPATWCMQKILGVTPQAPGFAQISFRPDLCDLEFAEGAIPTPHGLIHVKLQRGKDPQIICPAGVEII